MVHYRTEKAVWNTDVFRRREATAVTEEYEVVKKLIPIVDFELTALLQLLHCSQSRQRPTSISADYMTLYWEDREPVWILQSYYDSGD